MKVLVYGSRHWTDREVIFDRLVKLAAENESNVLVIQGGAQGADRIAAEVARELKLKVVTVDADWRRHGRAAGPIRNQAMLDLNPELALGYRDYGDSPGSDDMTRRCRKRGVPIELTKVNRDGSHWVEQLNQPASEALGSKRGAA